MGEIDKWPYVVKPLWVHDLLRLWRRKQPYNLYIDQVTDYTAREVHVEAMRRGCVAWLADHFAPSRSAYTLAQNVWSSYSHQYGAKELAPAYLTYLTLREPLARRAAVALQFQMQPGTPVNRASLLHSFNKGAFSNRATAPGALEALLHTLQQWDVLAANPRQGGYMVEKPLRVAAPIFPLLVWRWWLETRQPHVSVAEFAQSPLWTWVDTSDFAVGWQRYAGRIWTLETVAGVPTVRLHPTDMAGFTRALLNLLSTDGRSGRQHPHQAQKDAQPQGAE